MEHQYIETNGIRLHVLQDGPKDAPLVILLHGFPDFSYGWKHQIPYLASAGYRVWAPDLRGYNLSDKPDGLASYYLDVFAADVVGLIEAAGQKKAVLVGHDVGAGIAWWVAAKYPDRLSKMVVMNAPYGAEMQKRLRGNFAQLLKLWYVFFFQIPWLPEFLFSIQNWNLLIQMLKNSSRPGTFTDSDLDQYRQAWSQPKAFTSMLNGYRAGLRKLPTPPANPRITVPTLLIWGAQDKFVGRELAQPTIDICDTGQLVFIEEGTHWVRDEEPERVNELIGTFLRDGMKD